MKIVKILLAGLFLSFGPLSYGKAPWGALDDFAQSTHPYSFQMGEGYLLPQILQGKPVRVLLQAKSDEQEYRTSIAQIYNEWFFKTAEIIEKSHREKEFADILPLLKKGVKIEFVKYRQWADIVIIIDSKSNISSACGGAMGCYKGVWDYAHLPRVYLTEESVMLKILSMWKASFSRVALHETGHSLGLSDQYPSARGVNSHPLYGSEEAGDSVMNHAYSITCDDADGLINLIDLVRGFSRGGEDGWKSLCPNSNDYYVNGFSTARGPYYISSSDNTVFNLDVYYNGVRKERRVFPLADQKEFLPVAAVQETILDWDGQARPLVTRGNNGETIYYSYFFEGVHRLAVKDGKALWVERSADADGMHRKDFYFKRNGLVVRAILDIDDYGESRALYEEQETPGRLTLTSIFLLDDKGRVMAENHQAQDNRPQADTRLVPNDAQKAGIDYQQLQQALRDVQEKKLHYKHIKEDLLRWYRQMRKAK